MADFLGRSWWSKMDVFAAFLSAVAICLYFGGDMIGRFEGSQRPVVVDFEVSKVEPLGDRRTMISGSFYIIRPACDYDHMEAHILGNDRAARVPMDTTADTQARAGGYNEFGPWVLDLPPNLLDASELVVLHRCPWRPWLTRTRLFP